MPHPITFFSAKPYDETFFNQINEGFGFELNYHEAALKPSTVKLAEGSLAVCAFVNDVVNAATLQQLAALGVKVLALRCAGFNNVDLEAAKHFGVVVVRVPAYSPAAVAEHAVGLMLSLSRKYHKAYHRVREGNLSLNGLVGFDMKGKTIGVVGTGKIGQAVLPILKGFGCTVLMYDTFPNAALVSDGCTYVDLNTLWRQSDLITLHCPLLPETHHLVNEVALQTMKPGVVLINTSRGGLIDTQALIDALKQGHLGAVGLDVYEEEENLFFRDWSEKVIQDDQFSRLLTFPNVLITGHQAFLTETALRNIAETTLTNIQQELAGTPSPNRVG